MREIALLEGERDRPAATNATFDRHDPLSRDVATRAAAATVADAGVMADVAAAALPGWAAIGPSERRALLMKAADGLEARMDDFVSAVSEETGATAPWGQFNVAFAAGLLREAAAMTSQVSGEVIPSDKPGCLAMSFRQPAGVVLGIAPWNAPVILGVRAVAVPLACGNTVILKASEKSPATHHLIGEVLRDAGLPAGAINVITHAPEDAPGVVEALIAHPAIRRVNFTGSTKTGRSVAEVAGRHLKRVLLELGGKASLIVLDDADLEEAANAAIFGSFSHQGQICMATERLVVDEKVADEFVRRLTIKTQDLPAGDPRQGPVVVGSMVEAEAAMRVKALIDDAVGKGARVLCGGAVEGTLVEPTVVDGVAAGMRLYGEESFGPVVGVIRVSGVDEAVRVANDTEYGLSASVYTQNVTRAVDVARRIDSGICHINGPTVSDEGQMPFGGTKASGNGRFGGRAGIEEFTELRWVTIDTLPAHYPFPITPTE